MWRRRTSAPYHGSLEPDRGSGVRRKCVYTHPFGIVWDYWQGPTTLKPHVCSIVRGSLFSNKTYSQVFTIRLVNPLFYLVVGAIVSSLVGLVLVRVLGAVCFQFWRLWSLLWITLSQHSTHIKRADLGKRVWRMQDALQRWAW
jgi:hypothetical protein